MSKLLGLFDQSVPIILLYCNDDTEFLRYCSINADKLDFMKHCYNLSTRGIRHYLNTYNLFIDEVNPDNIGNEEFGVYLLLEYHGSVQQPRRITVAATSFDDACRKFAQDNECKLTIRKIEDRLGKMPLTSNSIYHAVVSRGIVSELVSLNKDAHFVLLSWRVQHAVAFDELCKLINENHDPLLIIELMRLTQPPLTSIAIGQKILLKTFTQKVGVNNIPETYKNIV